jgi:hypothetical protein
VTPIYLPLLDGGRWQGEPTVPPPEIESPHLSEESRETYTGDLDYGTIPPWIVLVH